MAIAVKKISELPYQGNPQNAGEIEFEQGGVTYRVPLGILLQVFADYARASTPTSSKPFWKSTPVYSIDAVTLAVTIEAGGVAYYAEAEHPLAASSSLTIPALVQAGTERFDALLYDTQGEAYTLLVGTENANPVTPAYNALRYLLLGYVHSSEEAVTQSTTPDDHVQNTDQYMDYGGTNQISAYQAKEVYTKMLDYLARWATPEDLPTGLGNYYFALVYDPLSLWLYDPATDTWTQAGGGSGISAQSQIIVLDEYTTSSPPLVLKGPKSNLALVTPAEVASYSFQARLDAVGTFTDLSDLTALNAWVASNVTTSNTLWRLVILVTYTSGWTGETSINFQYQ